MHSTTTVLRYRNAQLADRAVHKRQRKDNICINQCVAIGSANYSEPLSGVALMPASAVAALVAAALRRRVSSGALSMGADTIPGGRRYGMLHTL